MVIHDNWRGMLTHVLVDGQLRPVEFPESSFLCVVDADDLGIVVDHQLVTEVAVAFTLSDNDVATGIRSMIDPNTRSSPFSKRPSFAWTSAEMVNGKDVAMFPSGVNLGFMFLSSTWARRIHMEISANLCGP